ncbi:MAG: class I SAM-dependent methyltransferase [bacterium]|nr:class I SAM-dependent methyltransferase [bacterium]
MRKIEIYEKEDMRVYIEKEEMFCTLFRRVVSFIARYKARGKFLDIGAGVGLLVREARRAGFVANGLEPSKAGVEIARKKFGIRLIPHEFALRHVHGTWDVIVFNHVLEHVKNPEKTISDATAILKRSGLLVIGLPNFSCILSKLKKGRWQSLIPAQHRWHFTISTLDKLVLKHGYIRLGLTSDNHDRSMHPLWKRPAYFLLDMYSKLFNNGEAILAVYKKKL